MEFEPQEVVLLGEGLLVLSLLVVVPVAPLACKVAIPLVVFQVPSSVAVGDEDERKDAVGTDACEELVGTEGRHAAAADGEEEEAPFCYDRIVIWAM